jgi:hypothetical protein
MPSSTLLPHFGQYINFILNYDLLENEYLRYAPAVEAGKKSYMHKPNKSRFEEREEWLKNQQSKVELSSIRKAS